MLVLSRQESQSIVIGGVHTLAVRHIDYQRETVSMEVTTVSRSNKVPNVDFHCYNVINMRLKQNFTIVNPDRVEIRFAVLGLDEQFQTAHVGVEAPKDVKIIRGELKHHAAYKRIRREVQLVTPKVRKATLRSGPLRGSASTDSEGFSDGLWD
jgi:sRNA-binding carbon storage regulator CsrA